MPPGSYRAWKALERRHAKRLDGTRLWRPDFADSIPDGETSTETWDTKAYQRFSVITLFAEAERKYREFTGARDFHLCIFGVTQRAAGDFVLVPAERFARLLQLERAANELRP